LEQPVEPSTTKGLRRTKNSGESFHSRLSLDF
jgi:hypothetical protein